MLMLIDTRDRWEPEPPSAPRRRPHPIRPTKAVGEAIVAIVLIAAGMVSSGVASVVLLYLGVLAAATAAGNAIPYRLGLKEHHQ